MRIHGYLLRKLDLASRTSSGFSSAEKGLVHESGKSFLLTHGQKTPRVYVLIHGVTNSPTQWLEYGQMMYERGHNVLIVRMPYHGLKSNSVSELRKLTPQDLRAYGDQVIDIAAGLGDEVYVAGISGGGAVTAWAVQNRPEVDRAFMVAPFFGVDEVPDALSNVLMNAFSHLPNFDISRAEEVIREYAYPGQATRAVADFLVLGHSVRVDAKQGVVPHVPVFVQTTVLDLAANNCTPSQGSGSYSYLWSFGDDPTNTSTDRNTTHEYDEPGSYIVSLTVTDSLGEQATWTVDVTVNPMLRVTGTSATALDVGQTVSFRCTPSYGTTPYTYSWTFGDGGTSSLQNPSHTYSSPGLYTSNVTVTGAAGGQSSWTSVILVNALPSVTGTATPTAIDSGRTVYFTCTPSNGTGSYTFLWTFGDGSPGSTAQSPSHIYASEGSYTVNVTATDDVGEQAIWTVVRSQRFRWRR